MHESWDYAHFLSGVSHDVDKNAFWHVLNTNKHDMYWSVYKTVNLRLIQPCITRLLLPRHSDKKSAGLLRKLVTRSQLPHAIEMRVYAHEIDVVFC